VGLHHNGAVMRAGHVFICPRCVHDEHPACQIVCEVCAEPCLCMCRHQPNHKGRGTPMSEQHPEIAEATHDDHLVENTDDTPTAEDGDQGAVTQEPISEDDADDDDLGDDEDGEG
jgi:hypothetical protein